MLRTLIAIRLKGLFSRMVRGTKEGKKSGNGKKILMGFLIFYVAIVFLGMSTAFFNMIVEPYVELGLGWLYFAMMAIFIITISFIGSVFIAQQELYDAKDNDLLLALPLKPRDILLSRVFVILIFNYLYEAMIAIPAVGVYVFKYSMTISQAIILLIVLITLPLVVLILSCLFGWILANIMKRVRYKNFIALGFSVLFFGLYMVAVNQIGDYINILINNGNSLAAAIEKGLFPIYHMAVAISDGNFLNLGLYLLSVIIPFILVIYVLSMNFIKVLTLEQKTKKIEYKHKPMKSKSIFWSLVVREIKHFTSSAMVMMNGSMGVVFYLISAVAIFIYMDNVNVLLEVVSTEIPFLLEYIAPVAAFAICAMGSMNLMSCTLISLEGDRLWIIKHLPIDPKDVIMSKVMLHLIMSIPGSIVLSCIVSFVLNLSLLDAGLVIIAPIVFNAVIGLFGMVINLLYPKFDWINETACVKQSMSVIITMFSSMAFVFVLGFVGFHAVKVMSLNQFAYIVVALFILMAYGFYWLLTTWGVKVYNEL